MDIPEGAPVPVTVVGPRGSPTPGTAEGGHGKGVEGAGEGGWSWSTGSAVGRGGAGTDSLAERGELVPLVTVGTCWFRALAHTVAPAGLGRTDRAKAGHAATDGLVCLRWVSVPERGGTESAAGTAAPLTTAHQWSVGGTGQESICPPGVGGTLKWKKIPQVK